MEKEQVNEYLEKKNYLHVKNYRKILKEKLVEYKGGKCEICGYNKCVEALEFHHLNPEEKDFGISSYSSLSFDKAKKEVDKCILVCANGHREIHYELNEKKRIEEAEKEKNTFIEILKNREEYEKVKKVKNSYKFLSDAGILDDMKNGVKRKEILKKYHINNGTFKRFLDENNIEYMPKKVVENKPSKEELSLLLKEHSKAAIARIYGISWNAVAKWCKKYGISFIEIAQ